MAETRYKIKCTSAEEYSLTMCGDIPSKIMNFVFKSVVKGARKKRKIKTEVDLDALDGFSIKESAPHLLNLFKAGSSKLFNLVVKDNPTRPIELSKDYVVDEVFFVDVGDCWEVRIVVSGKYLFKGSSSPNFVRF